MRYPIFLDIQDMSCLIAGFGAVGQRKALGLLDAGARHIAVVDPALAQPDERQAALLANPAISPLPRVFMESDLDGRQLIFAATDNAAVNADIAAYAKQRGILCNVATSREKSNFLVPSRIEVGGLHAAVMTNGDSPALSRRLRLEMTDLLQNFEALASLMARLRPLVLAHGWPVEKNTALFRAVCGSDLAGDLFEKNENRAKERLHALLPDELHPHIGELLHDLL